MSDKELEQLMIEKEKLLKEKELISKYMKHSIDVANLEVNLAFDLANSLDILIGDIESRYNNVGFKLSHEKKDAFTKFNKDVRSVHNRCEIFCGGTMNDAYKDDFNSKENRLSRSYELVRLCLLFADRTAISNKNYVDVLNYMIDMNDGLNLIEQEDFDRFKFKEK